ncbi:MAG: hypothetical protein NTV08_00155 [Verrucomicrobia bacterium]|nr:hypothetical protein [Verrucomicrobiota bacterium]
MKKRTSTTKSAEAPLSKAALGIAAYNLTEKEKRPEPEKVENLHLDPKNPRLADTAHTGTQASIMKVMSREFDLQPLIDSMYRNGYFYEEPLVAVMEPLAELNNRKALLVIEGNRRLAALKTILHNPDVYSDKEARARLERVPVIVRDERKETLPFVGFRHITGILAWDAAAKAQYAHDLVKRGLTLDEIAQTIGDKTRDIARWVRTQSLLETAHENGLTESDAAKKFYFSYLLTCTDAPATKRWLELITDDKSGLVKSINAERLEEVWLWLYGSKAREIAPVIPESRQIHKLNRVIASPRAVQELKNTGNLDRALVETKERGEYVVDTLVAIRSLLQDLSGNLTGDEKFSESLSNTSKIREAKVEFARVDKALGEVREKLGF